MAFAILSAAGDLAVFAADVAPSVSAENFWRIDWVSLLVESLLKFVLIGEIFSRVLAPYPSVSRLGRVLITGFGTALVLVSSLIAAFARGDSSMRLIAGFHLLEQTVFLIELGLVLFLFIFTAHFRLSWDRFSFGLLLGLGISACVHLATWAVVANGAPSSLERTYIDFLNMATYHVCVLIWFYYLLVPQKVVEKIAVTLPENNLAVWNRELERLLQQ
ncbi:MAG TPA: hypothetical protein VE377_01075 [Candidatus Dormibacteraeota bacterium]|nr:hypothetical protein [Candidatus Dormibacteraeota bacterium]